MRVSHISASISNSAAGVSIALKELTMHMLCLAEHVSVVAIDDDRHLATQMNGTVDYFPCKRLGPRSVGFSLGMVKTAMVSDPDILHSHGLWMYPGIAARRAATNSSIPLIISPHGMLDSWALKNSAWKKKIAGWLYENRNLRSAACIHALCESEYQSIRAYGLKNPVAIIPNGVDLPSPTNAEVTPPWEPRVDADKNVMLFLGRIHPKKGLENLIRAWSFLKAHRLAALDKWHLVVAGWSQGGHEEKLKQLANEMNLGSDVLFTGPLYDTAKDVALQAAKAFILPSFSEGLPMAVLEAWAYDLPVIMTRECNIPKGFEAGAALDIRPDVNSILEGLTNFLLLSNNARKQMGRNGLGLVRSRYSWPKIASQMVDVYKWILGQGPKPDCVRLD